MVVEGFATEEYPNNYWLKNEAGVQLVLIIKLFRLEWIILNRKRQCTDHIQNI
jgi:hypothetical protein